MKKVLVILSCLISTQALAQEIIFENYLNPGKSNNPGNQFFDGNSTAGCIALVYSNPIGWQVIGAITIARELGAIKDRKKCFEVVEDTKQITEILTKDSDLGDVIHGLFGRCGCRFVFKDTDEKEEANSKENQKADAIASAIRGRIPGVTF